MRQIHRAGLIALSAALVVQSGCAVNLSPEATAAYCLPIDLAMATPADQLRAAADKGDAQAQYALSILRAFGLQGQPVDSTQAQAWRSRALASRGTIVRTMYFPGYKGHPGYVMPIVIPQGGLSIGQVVAVNSCLAVLNGQVPSDISEHPNICGGPDNYHRLSAAWVRAKAPSDGQPKSLI